MTAVDLVGLPALMALGPGRADVVVGLLDGAVDPDAPELHGADVTVLGAAAGRPGDASARHATAVAAILVGPRDGTVPGICPGCRLLVRPIFDGRGATPGTLARAVLDAVDAGAHLLNLSVALAAPSVRTDHELVRALDHAARRGVIVVAAAGNQGTLGTSSITRHPCVLPVTAHGDDGRPLELSNLGASIGRRGVGAPGEAVVDPGGGPRRVSGTSLAAPVVTGTIALLWSLFPDATAGELRAAVAGPSRRRGVLPPLLDAWAAYRAMAAVRPGVPA